MTNLDDGRGVGEYMHVGESEGKMTHFRQPDNGIMISLNHFFLLDWRYIAVAVVCMPCRHVIGRLVSLDALSPVIP